MRSTLKLDLKDLCPEPSTPHIGKIGLVVVSAIAIVSTVVSIDNPSASTASLIETERVHTSDLIFDGRHSDSTQATMSQRIKDRNADADHISQTDNSKAAQTTQKPYRRREIRFATMAPSLNRAHPDPVVSIIEADPKFALRTDNRIPDSKPERTQVAMLMPQQSQTISDSSEQDRGIAAILNNDSVEFDSAQETQQEPKAVASINSSATIPAYDSSNDNLTSSTTTISETISTVNQFAAKDWRVEKVKKRDTLSQIFNRLGLSSSDAYSLVEVEEAAPLKLIRPGQNIEVIITPSKEEKGKEVLAALRYKLDKFSSLVVLRIDQGFKADIEVKEPTIEHRLAKATIDHSLLGAAKNADIPYDIVYKLASIFGWQIDFARDIQPGDQIALIYEELILDDQVVGQGQIVAAELLTADKQYRAIRHIDEENRVTYFAPDGDGIQGSFLRSPIKFARVTSKFSKKRFHPIQKKWKAHKGVDYGAPMKTPILATGDGVVTLAGSKKGYGKTVVIKHGHKYQTLYAHMNSYAKGIKSGSRVKQGDVIGYVGKTGWTTGPHLHYEFRLNGIHQNPLTVELPKSAPIDTKYHKAFQKEAEVWVAALDRAGRIPLAQNDQ